MTNAQSFFYRSVAVTCVALSANTAFAQTLQWSTAEKFDQGDQTSLAVQGGFAVSAASRCQPLFLVFRLTADFAGGGSGDAGVPWTPYLN
jgi:hypothetical protein